MSQQQAEKPPVHNLYRGVGTQVMVTAWNGDRAYLASDRYPKLETQQWGYEVYRVPKETQGMVLVSEFPSRFVPDGQISAPCRYVKTCNAPASIQCPHCTRWYCAGCANELFLDLAKIIGEIAILPAPLCPECHYALFWRPRLESERAE